MAQDRDPREGIPQLGFWERVGLNYGTPGGAVRYQLGQQEIYMNEPQRQADVSLTNARARGLDSEIAARKFDLDQSMAENENPFGRMQKLYDRAPPGELKDTLGRMLGLSKNLSTDEQEKLAGGLEVQAAEQARQRSAQLAVEEELQLAAQATGVDLTVQDLAAIRDQLMRAGIARMPTAQQSVAIQAAVAQAAMERASNVGFNQRALGVGQVLAGGLPSGPGGAGGSGLIEAMLGERKGLPAGFGSGAAVAPALREFLGGAATGAQAFGSGVGTVLGLGSDLVEAPFHGLINFLSGAAGGQPLSDPDRQSLFRFLAPSGPQVQPGPFESATGGRRL